MKLRTEHQDRALIVSVSGRVDAGNAREFEAAMFGVLDQGGKGVVLDCENLDYVSSAGLRVVLMVTKHLDRERVPFLLCSLPAAVSAVFEISGFDQVIPVCGSRAEALATLPR